MCSGLADLKKQISALGQENIPTGTQEKTNGAIVLEVQGLYLPEARLEECGVGVCVLISKAKAVPRPCFTSQGWFKCLPLGAEYSCGCIFLPEKSFIVIKYGFWYQSSGRNVSFTLCGLMKNLYFQIETIAKHTAGCRIWSAPMANCKWCHKTKNILTFSSGTTANWKFSSCHLKWGLHTEFTYTYLWLPPLLPIVFNGQNSTNAHELYIEHCETILNFNATFRYLDVTNHLPHGEAWNICGKKWQTVCQ